jgi:hypothetical protein
MHPRATWWPKLELIVEAGQESNQRAAVEPDQDRYACGSCAVNCDPDAPSRHDLKDSY